MSNKLKEMIVISDEIKLAKDDVIDTFSDKELLAPYLEAVAKAVTVDESEINLNTDKGRKEVASRSHKVSKIKTALVKVAKDSIEDLKAQVQAVNGGTKHIEEVLDKLRDTTRAPLTLWEAEQKRIEEERIAAIKLEIGNIESLGQTNGTESIEDLSAMIEAVDNIDVAEGFDEFTQDAMKAIAAAKNNLTAAMQKLIEQKQQEEMQRKLAAERLANQINERINNLRMIPLDFMSKSALEIEQKIVSLEKFRVPVEEFGERANEATQAKDAVVTQLRAMHQQAVIVEEAQARKAEEERIATEQARADQEMAAAAHESMAPPEVEREQQATGVMSSAEFHQEAPVRPAGRAYVAATKAQSPKHKEITFYLFNSFGVTMEQAEGIATAIESGQVPYVSIINQQSRVA